MSRLLRLRPLLTTTTPLSISSRASSSFSRGPSPPRLPAEQQAEFERLQRAASVSSAFQHLDPANSSSSSPSSSSASAEATATASAAATESQQPANPTISSDEETMHPAYVRGAPPEFEGDVNPRTGEVGGPKREPLRWGAGGDWSYNGRVTDF